jgi:outer membrane protein OmpA-like peptidoglycan-associated protein
MVLLGPTLLALLSGPVAAQERDVDTQLVPPVLSTRGAWAVDSPDTGPAGSFQGGAAWGFELLPLRAYVDGQPVAPAVGYRNSLFLGAGVALPYRSALSLRIAGVQQHSRASEGLAPARAIAVSDLALRGKLGLLDGPRFSLGPEIELWLPTGTGESWVGERGFRAEPAALAELRLGPTRLMGSLGLVLRPEVAEGIDLDLGQQLSAGLALDWALRPRFSLLAELSSRHGLDSFLQAGGENPAVIMAGGRGCLPHRACFDLAVGSSLSHGYGASALRVMLAYTPRPGPPAPEPEPEVVLVAPAPLEATVRLEPPPREQLTWAPGVLAQVYRGRILIRDPILFEQGTAVILPESLPTLAAVSALVNRYPEIAHLVVEGHASEEGGTAFNYDLSVDRARAVFEVLVGSSVRPERVSYRGLGELYPPDDLERDQAPAARRRVDFIIASLGPLNVGDDRDLLLPWSGEALPAPTLGRARLGSDAHPLLEQTPVELPQEEQVDPSFFLDEPADEEDEP